LLRQTSIRGLRGTWGERNYGERPAATGKAA
jgi:hypothetical protein